MNSDTHSTVSTIVFGEEMHLLSEKAIHLPRHNMLLIADLHLGKVEHFRKHGIGIPSGASKQDLSKLKQLVQRVNAQEVVFLGDLFHSDFNKAWFDFQQLLQELSAYNFHLVIGNHDILDESKYEKMKICYQMEVGNLILTHEPMDVIIEDNYNLCGHIHPGVRLTGKGRQNLRLPCFYFGAHTGILPAFGSFTGLHVLKPLEDDKVFVVNDNLVIEVSNS
ncbi:MAG: ligase-associated DNA damage response endonuclease PdeM [Bacteroidota bacterium]